MKKIRRGVDAKNAVQSKSLSRRALLGWAGGAVTAGVVAGGVGFTSGQLACGEDDAPRDAIEPPSTDHPNRSTLNWEGASQPGVDRPATPQTFCRLAVYRVSEEVDPSTLLAAIGANLSELASLQRLDEKSELTVTVGVGPEFVRRIGSGIVGDEDLPSFVGDESIDPTYVGGDLMLLCAANDPTVLGPGLVSITTGLHGVYLQWEQFGFRGPSEGTRTRNPLGFHDGVIVPKTPAELMEHVWFGGKNRKSTICVVRRFALDQEAFSTLEIADRERAVGRDLEGRPLSGGDPFEEVDLMAKHPDGELLIAMDAHVRLAHPSFTASDLMLRRSYAYDTGSEAGLLFISYQKQLRSFVETQRRMDEQNDAMMRYARPTASATFLIIPGQNSGSEFGESLITSEEQSND